MHWERGARLSIVEDDTAAGHRLQNEVQCGSKAGVREVGDNAQPGKHRLFPTIQTSNCQGMRELLTLKIDWHQLRAWRQNQTCRCEHLPLPGLRMGMIHLEHPQMRKRIPQRECIQTRPKQNVLRRPRRYSFSEAILGKPASRDEPRSQRKGVWPVRASRRTLQLRTCIGPKKGNDKRVCKNEGMCVVELMCGSSQSNPECR